MIVYKLKITLLSDTTFGRGDGVAGVIDQEVEHDNYGFPYLRGRTLKGLLSEESDNLISVVPKEARAYWENIACTLFGIPGSSLETMGILHVGDACLPEDLRTAVAWQIKNEELTNNEILDSLTAIRRQTAINSQIGVADEGSLRSFRVVIRQLEFEAKLIFETQPKQESLSLLAASVLALRRIGSGRNRGRGHVKCSLHDNAGEDITHDYLNLFGKVMEEVK
ncbi:MULTISPECIES: RAMP superfamily CRISPR-associated protein [unclassified Nostoc]|uniref:RAMP superfamily CRISPR-associated protein n=1 Tax=unclassified Nostoc TaxID=2593658 RepID=UPI002AD2236B|nr:MULTISPECIES: RAMP superfamily CRISPR-associated protein [unclassified Nostoc]MDZ8122123.1 RAMP superfamily CRISPR-associated protein [Nostoc sp. CmiVER01]MDZ8227616.1 RAMP superfamily CRISPR-associated protein [Nostoc sp. ChiVER01]